jgi:ParB family chromosome partitioning protein
MDKQISMMPTLEIRTASPFKDLFPIRETTLNEIVEDMKKNGYDYAHPITIWAGHKVTVVDGHSRLKAALQVGMSKVPIMLRNFADEEEALQYAIHSQSGRRNLTDAELLNCISLIDTKYSRGGSSKATREAFGKSAQKTADLLGISRGKVEKLRTVNDHASSQVKDAVLNGKLSVNKAYNETMAARRAEKRASEPVSETCKPVTDDWENETFTLEEQLEIIKKHRIINIPEIIIDTLERTVKQEKNNYPDIHYSEVQIAQIQTKIQNELGRILSGLA